MRESGQVSAAVIRGGGDRFSFEAGRAGRNIMTRTVQRPPGTFREIPAASGGSADHASCSVFEQEIRTDARRVEPNRRSLEAQLAGVNAFEVATFDPFQRAHFVVDPTIVRSAGHEPIATVIGQQHAVLLQARQNHLR